MDTKYKLTAEFLKDWLGQEPDELTIVKYYTKWWQNIRSAENRSLRLTYDGFSLLKNQNLLKFYQIDTIDTVVTGQVVIRLDKYLDCPWYLDTFRCIWVSREKVAVQLILFDGDLVKFVNAKHRSNEMSKENSLTS